MASGYRTQKTARARIVKVPEAPQLNNLYIVKRQVMDRSENCCEVCRRNTCFEAKRPCFATIRSKTRYSQNGQSTLLTLRAAGAAFYRPLPYAMPCTGISFVSPGIDTYFVVSLSPHFSANSKTVLLMPFS